MDHLAATNPKDFQISQIISATKIKKEGNTNKWITRALIWNVNEKAIFTNLTNLILAS